jgi:hypothetical protein
MLKKTIQCAVLAAVCMIPQGISAQDNKDIEALQGFPARRLNYMFNQYVVPTVLKDGDDPGMFVHAKYFGEGRPVDDGRHWLGLRTLQAYKKENGTTMSMMFDAYKSYDYGRESRFEMNAAFGYGYTTKDWGVHAGLFTGLILGKPQLSPSAYTSASGPVAVFDEAEGIGGSLDWYAYYKYKNLAKIRAIFKNKGRPDANSADRKSKAGFEVIGGSFKDLFNLDYYRSEKLLLFDTRLSDPVKKALGEERFESGFLSRIDANVRLGAGFGGQGISEYALAWKYNGKRWEYGLDIYKARFTDGNLGFVAIYNLPAFDDLIPGGKMRFVMFRNYTPMVLEMHSKSAAFLELRIQI